MSSAPTEALATCVVLSAAVMIITAGLAKVMDFLHGEVADSAIRRVLKLNPPRWRFVATSVAVIECATGAAVCCGLFRTAAGISMAVLGAGFTGLQVRARQVKAPGGCGCMPSRHADQRLTWRDPARAGWVLVAGLGEFTGRAGGVMNVIHPWPDAGVAIGGAFGFLGAGFPVRLPVCHRPLWRPVHGTSDLLKRSGTFQAMANSVGPFRPRFTHRRDGCSDVFRFSPVLEGDDGDYVAVFRVRHTAGHGGLAIHGVVQTTYEDHVE